MLSATTREEREAAINRIIGSQGEGLMRHHYHMHGNENDAEAAKQPLEAVPNVQGDGFVFYVAADKSKAIELRVKDGMVVREE